MKYGLVVVLMWAVVTSASRAEVVVERDEAGWDLRVDGQPFYVKGVTWGGGPYDEASWRADFVALRALRANAIRTWGAGEDTRRLLDMAQEYDIKVMVGLWLRHGRPGAEDDDSFDWVHDAAGREAQWNDKLATVEALKDHPAVLCWGLGNEVILNIATEAEKHAYATFLGQLAAEIKKHDDQHPIASVSAWSIGWPYWKQHAPALDIYGVNTYGYGAGALPGEQERLDIDRPYLICEFGATGEWETQDNRHGVKLDPSEDQKFGIIAHGWSNMIQAHSGKNLGGFVFHLGNKLDSTGLWLGLRTDNLWRPAYHGTMKAFSDQLPGNQLPQINTFDLDKDEGNPSDWVAVDLQVHDPENQPLQIRFAYNERRGEHHHRDAVIELNSRQTDDGNWEIQLPSVVEPGGIKLYALVDEGINLSIAQSSILVTGDP